MKKNYKSLTIWTLAANLFVLISDSRGIGPVIVLEIIRALSGAFFISIKDSRGVNHNTITIFLLILVIGQLSLFLSLFIKKKLLKLFAIGVLWMAFVFLIINIAMGRGDSLLLVILSATPFFILSRTLFLKTLRVPQ